MRIEEQEWKKKWFRIIFKSDTRQGQLFDIILLWLILASLLTVLFDSIPFMQSKFSLPLKAAEWVFTLLFTIEYIARILVSPKKSQYIFSFYGVVDLLAILPGYISLLIPGLYFMMVVRALRLLRVFRILRLGRYLNASDTLIRALVASRYKITVFIGSILTIVTIVGALLYLIEGPENGFTSIPIGMYWAIVTLTTVGFGDITPQTPLGRILASLVMLMGYGILAVPTGIVTSQLTAQALEEKKISHKCANCNKNLPKDDALYCKYCGSSIIMNPTNNII